jgi:hypothetical protein
MRPGPGGLAVNAGGGGVGSSGAAGATGVVTGGVVASPGAGPGDPGTMLSVPPLAGPLLPRAMLPVAAGGAVVMAPSPPLLLELTSVGGALTDGALLASVGAGEPGMTTVAVAGTGSSLALSQPAAKAATSAAMPRSGASARRRRKAARNSWCMAIPCGLRIVVRQALCPPAQRLLALLYRAASAQSRRMTGKP